MGIKAAGGYRLPGRMGTSGMPSPGLPRRMGLLLMLVVTAALLPFASPSFAQTLQDLQRAQQESQRLILEEQQREQQRRREIEERLHAPRGQDLQPKPLSPPSAVPGRCFQIQKVVLEGANSLSAAERDELTNPLIGRCVGLDEINELIQRITNLYVLRGYTTTRAYIPEQDLSKGELHILLLEGLVEKIILDGEGVSLRLAFPDMEGKVFNLREFEQGIDQINRLRSNSATMDIEPGVTPGASVIRIKNSPGKRWSIGLAADNTGSASTGYYQTSATLGLDDPLGANDYLSLSVRQNPDMAPDKRMSRSSSVMYAVPYGAWLFTANASSFDSVSTIQGTVLPFRSSTASDTQSVKVERVMFRDQHTKLTLSTGLTAKDSSSYVNGQLINVASRNLSVWDVNANLSINAWGGLWSFDLGVAEGLKSLGAMNDASGLPDIAPRAQFSKQTFGVNLSMPLKLGSVDLAFQSTFSGQHSRDVLYGTEQILIGGPFSVRGFRQTSISGDSGYYWRNEIGVPLALARVLGNWADNGLIKPYIAFDLGHVADKHGVPGGTLAGSTIGLNVFVAPVSLQFAYSRPQNWPTRLAGNSESYTYFRVAVDF